MNKKAFVQDFLQKQANKKSTLFHKRVLPIIFLLTKNLLFSHDIIKVQFMNSNRML